MKGKARQRFTEHGTGQAQKLLDGLYRQRGELGDIASDLISRLKAAGIKLPAHSSKQQDLRDRTRSRKH